MKRITLRAAAFVSITIAALTSAMHVLVIAGVMPFEWLNGGRSATFSDARQTSMVSIVVLFVWVVVVLLGGKIIPVRRGHKVLTVMPWMLFAYSCLSVVLQLLGTMFERYVTSVLCILNAVATFRLAIEERSNK